MYYKNILFCSLILGIIRQVTSYIELPLVKYNNYYAFPVLIQNAKYELILSLENSPEFITPTSSLSNSKKRKNKSEQNNVQKNGIVTGVTIEGNSFEGWKQFFSEAFFFSKPEFEHQWKINLSSIDIKSQHQQNNTGLMNLSPNIENNKFYSEFKKDNIFIHEDIFSIYIGPTSQRSKLHFGGYQINNGMILDNRRFKKVPIIQNSDQWIISSSKIKIIKSDHQNKWKQFNLYTGQIQILLTLKTNALVLKKQIIKQFENLLETENITCRMYNNLICQNITDRDLDDHLIEFQIGFSTISFTLRRLLISCDKTAKSCTFKVQTGQKYMFGQFFFEQYYSVFNMNAKTLIIAHCNKYPKQSWQNEIFLLRFVSGILFFIFFIIFILCLPDVIDRYKKWKNTKAGIQGIELISGFQQSGKLSQ